MRDFDGCTTFSFPFPFVFPARIWKTRFSTRFSNPMESSRPTLRYSGELLLSVCPFFRLLARVHSIPFRLVCAGRGRRGSVCGMDRSISRMKDRVNENKWYFQRLFDSDFFFFFFFVSADSREYSWMKTKITSSPFKVKAWCAKGEKHDVFFEKADRFLNLSLSVKINSRSPLIFLGSPNSARRHVKTRLILNPAFGTNWK